MYCTETEPHVARKPHHCLSCGEIIAVGKTYVRWRVFDGGDAGTVKMRPECYEAHCKAQEPGVPLEFEPYANKRGSAGDD